MISFPRLNQSSVWWLTLIAHLATLILIVSWQAWLAPSEHYPIAIILIILLLPLLLILRGLLNHQRKSFIWLSYICWFYFTLGVGDAYSDPADRVFGYLLVALSLMMFVCAMLYLRTPTSVRPE